MSDPIHSPSHYTHGGIERADVVDALLTDAKLTGTVSWWWGNFLKYGTRWPFKGITPTERIQDLYKARECIDRTISAYEEDRSRASAHVAEMIGEQ